MFSGNVDVRNVYFALPLSLRLKRTPASPAQHTLSSVQLESPSQTKIRVERPGLSAVARADCIMLSDGQQDDATPDRARAPDPIISLLLAGQKEALELAVTGAPLVAVLTVLARTAQSGMGRDAQAAIYVVTPDGASVQL